MPGHPQEPSPDRKIALGIDTYLDEFAAANSAISWKVFARRDPLHWKDAFFERMSHPDSQILFNLKGVDVWKGVTRAANRKGGATDWELLQISQNELWWGRIEWIMDGQRMPNPFA